MNIFGGRVINFRISANMTLIAFLACLVNACVYGPKAERKNTLSYLDGQSYEQNPNYNLGGLNLRRKEKTTQIEGRVRLEDPLMGTPMRAIEVQLLTSKGEAIHTVTTDQNGEFKIERPIKNGNYTLKLISDRYVGLLSFDITSYKITGLTVTARKP